MKLSKLYTNKPELFEPIEFQAGLNVVLAEIRLPENREKDVHNLGKTTLGRLLNFCLLSQKDPNFFLFKHYKRFKEFIFFLEIKLDEANYVTIRRDVENATKISYKKSISPYQDFNDLEESEWDHFELPFEQARRMLDSLLDLRVLKPWTYRNFLGYQLRGQNDYQDVFQLSKFKGAHSGWKPFLAHILGFDAELIKEHYEKDVELEAKANDEKRVESELGGTVEDVSKIEGMLLLKKEDAEKKQALLDAFDFRYEDRIGTKRLVGDIDETIAELNSRRYSLNKTKKKITDSLKDNQILFKPENAKRLFEQAGVLFDGQIKKDFQQLIDFNKAISEERRQYLTEELGEIETELKDVNNKLDKLGMERSKLLAFLSSADVFDKYKQVSNEIVTLKADIAFLENKRSFLKRLQELRFEIRVLKEECNELQGEIENDVEEQNANGKSLFSTIRLYFSEIIREVISHNALLSVSPNTMGHLEFKAEILDDSGNATSAGLGHTYNKLLCIAFDLAVMRAHLAEKFPRFVYHDGVFESLDPRKKMNLLDVYRRYARFGIQSVITSLDSELLTPAGTEDIFIEPDEVVLTLHDENEQGRLFKMKAW